MKNSLTIEIVNSATLGRCYYGTTYLVTSVLPLTEDSVRGLRGVGFLGYGQEFYVGKIEKRTESTEGLVQTYWTCKCESRVDSGD